MVASPAKWESLPGNADNMLAVDSWRCNFFNIIQTLVVRTNRPLVAPEFLKLYGGAAEVRFTTVPGSTKFGIALERPEVTVAAMEDVTAFLNPGQGSVGAQGFDPWELPFEDYLATFGTGVGPEERVISPVLQVSKTRL
jgi:hypothetical protein